MKKLLIFAVFFIICALVYNLDSLLGRWAFDKLCKTEGGSRVYGRLEPNKGWEVDSHDESAYMVPFNFGKVSFVRFRNARGVQFDARLMPQANSLSVKYEVVPASSSVKIKYQLKIDQVILPDDKRIGRRQYVIHDLDDGRLIATHTIFSYSWTKPERVVLSAPTGETCHAGSEATNFLISIRKLMEQQ